MKPIRVRIAPSPTGDPHVGTAYMALFNMVYARHFQGKFILRIEDTDQSRSRKEYEDNIFETLRWCGLQWDEGPDIGGSFGPYRQSERTHIYQKYCQKLLEEKKAYKCFATEKELQEMREIAKKTGQKSGYDRRYRNLSDEEIEEREKKGQPYVVRLKVPLVGECVFEDQIKGRISCPWSDIDDQILLKSDGFPTYHLANVIDDHLMGISHVIRGDEWISSTPKHILLYEYFGWEAPEFMHMPLLLGLDGKKLSKRKNPTSIYYYRDCGYLPEAFINFLSLMGYSMPEDQEIYTIQELISSFDPSRFGRSGAVFDTQKLDWLNQQYIIHHIPKNGLWEKIRQWGFSEEKMQELMPLCHTRIKNFGDFIELTGFLFINRVCLSETLLCIPKITHEQAVSIFQGMIWYMDAQENWKAAGFEAASHATATIFQLHHKKIVMKLLFGAICGKHQGPPLFQSIDLLGKDKTRARLLQAIEFLGGVSAKKLHQLKEHWDQQLSLMQ